MTKRKQQGKKPPKKERKRVQRPTQEQLEVRRERVRELWGKSDRRIARILITEGLFAPPVSRIAIDQAAFENSCRRNVTNDRAAIREEWRKRKRSFTVEDITETTEDYIARLQMRIDELDELLDDRTLKPTPRMLAHSEIRQIEALIAKARGVEQLADRTPEGDDRPDVPFYGIVVGTKRLTPAAQRKIDEWIGGGGE